VTVTNPAKQPSREARDRAGGGSPRTAASAGCPQRSGLGLFGRKGTYFARRLAAFLTVGFSTGIAQVRPAGFRLRLCRRRRRFRREPSAMLLAAECFSQCIRGNAVLWIVPMSLLIYDNRRWQLSR